MSQADSRRGELFVKLDAHLDDNDKIIEAGWLAELVYVRGLRMCKRLMSDGLISRGQYRRMTMDLVEPIERYGDPVESLVKQGLWEADTEGYLVVGWLGRNPSKGEIQGRQAEGGSRGNHERWHVRRGIVKEGCPYCESGTDRGRLDTESGSVGIATGGESHSESEANRSSSLSIARDRERDTDRDTAAAEHRTESPTDRYRNDKRIAQAADLLLLWDGSHDVANKKDSPQRWLVGAKSGRIDDIREEATMYLQLNPTCDAKQLATYLESCMIGCYECNHTIVEGPDGAPIECPVCSDGTYDEDPF